MSFNCGLCDMKCPLCDYPQYCPCESCLDRLPKGLDPWVWDKDGEYVNCANCGLYLHADGWLDIEHEQHEAKGEG